jgi:hypothetical protein
MRTHRKTRTSLLRAPLVGDAEDLAIVSNSYHKRTKIGPKGIYVCR